MLALTGGTIYVSPDDPPVPNGVVLIEGAAIAAVGALAIPANAETIDCSGCTIAAGFWNSHVHFFERKWEGAADIPADELSRQLQQTFTRHGFTSVFDLSSSWENTRRLRARVEAGEVWGPRIRTTGEGMIPPGGAPSDTVVAMMGLMKTPLPEIGDAERAAAEARRLLAAGVDGIKLFASAPRAGALSVEVMRAAADEAHRAGRPLFVHPNNAADVANALRAGADVIAHTTPASGPWDAEIAAGGAALTPTLALWKHFARHDRLSAQERVVETAAGQLRTWIERRGVVLFGTDLGAVDPDPSEELRLMAAAGMDFRQILASLTTAPAERFGARTSGRVAAGFDADLVVLRGDPARDLGALTAIELVVQRGRALDH